MKKILIIGGTSAIAIECLKIWLSQEPAQVYLVIRDEVKASLLLNDLHVRFPRSKIESKKLDFFDPIEIQEYISAVSVNGALDVALIAHGVLPDQEECQKQLPLLKRVMEINAISPILFAESCVQQMEGANGGIIGVIGSVAGDRGRKSNYAYGAAKGMIDRYVQGLQHRLAKTSNLKVCLIKPGPTATPMTDFLVEKGATLASPGEVAEVITAGMALGKPVIYAPKKWFFIMLIIRHLPRWLFHKLNI